MSSLHLPGLIDPHVHLREPGATYKEDFESGTRAALAGGFTIVLAMPNTQPPLTDAASLSLAENAAAAKAVCDYGIHLGAGIDNAGTAFALAPRTTGLKCYLDATYGPLHLQDLGVLRDHFARWPKNRPILCHAEERSLAAVLLLAQLEQRSVHICHVSRKAEIELIRDARQHGIAVTCEVTPHHLFLTQADLAHFPTPGRGEVRPVLATEADRAALWANLSVIDCLATDHAPHTLAEKDGSAPPPGFPGLETALPLMLTAVHDGQLDLPKLESMMVHRPRQIFGLPEQPNTWVEVDPDRKWMIADSALVTRCGWSPFSGRVVRGQVRAVTIRGQQVYHDGQFSVLPGSGHNLAPAFRPTIQP